MREYFLPLREEVGSAPAADPHQSTMLARHRPSCALALTHIMGRDGLIIRIDHEPGIPLSTAAVADPPQDGGLHLMRLIARGASDLSEHWLDPDPFLLRPDLIYVAEDREQIYLPVLPYEHQIFRAVLTTDGREPLPLIPWATAVFGWDQTLYRRLEPLVAQCAFDTLVKTLEAEGGHREPPARSGPPPPAPFTFAPPAERASVDGPVLSATPKSPRAKTILSGVHRWGKRALERLRPGPDPLGETAELRLDNAFFRIALLSEGLPGTRDEHDGMRSFILVDEFVVGRGGDAVDFWLDSDAVSRRHAVIRRRAGSFFIEDLGSTNGTLLDGKKLNRRREYLLPDRCRLTFADRAFYFEAGG